MQVVGEFKGAARRIRAAPDHALKLLIVIATGVAISTVLFAVLNGVLRGLPFPDQRTLVVVESASPERGVSSGGLTPAEALALDVPEAPFRSFGYYGWGGMTVFNEDRPRQFWTARVSAGFFRTLAVAPVLGHWFRQDDFRDSADAVVLSYTEWQRLFGGAEDAIGKQVETSAGSKRVIGVMPASFGYPSPQVGAWLPMRASEFPLDQAWVAQSRYLEAIARLDPALDAAQISERLGAMQAGLSVKYQLPEPLWSIGTRSLLDRTLGMLEGVLWAAFGVGLLVMLIACGNAVILIDANQSVRTSEQALQLALGSSRGRLLRELLIEILMISAVAAALGTVLAQISIALLRDLARGILPHVDAITVNAEVWAFALMMVLLVPAIGVLAGAMQVRAEAGQALQGGRGVLPRGRRRWLPALGVALSTASVVAGSALVISLWKLQAVDPGVRAEGVYALQLFRSGDAESLREFSDRMVQRLAGLPGVESVALTNAAPLSIVGNFQANPKLPERDEAEPFSARVRWVSSSYLALMGQALLEGRGIDQVDGAGAEPVIVINATMARLLFGAESAINRVIELPVSAEERLAHRIVGVVADIRNRGIREVPGPEALTSFATMPRESMTFLLRAPTGLHNPDRLLRDALFEIDPRESATRIFSLADEFDSGLASARFFARTLMVVSAGALVLAAFGVFAVASWRHRQRLPELGLRLAIGAPPGSLLRESLQDSAASAVLGVAMGSILAMFTLRALGAQLFGFDTTSASLSIVLFGVSVLMVTSLVAALPPALRALRVDPLSALRST